METRRELVLMIGVLAAFHVIVSFGAIGLLTRMTPAIDRILQENVYSIDAAEDMLATLGETGGQAASADAWLRFGRALGRARNNITEAAERALITRIEQSQAAALAGDRAAILGVIADVRELIAVNRRAMTEVDRNAQRMGAAGAWAAVFIALVAFVLGIIVVLRLQRRFLGPIAELDQVLTAVRKGDLHRRCRSLDAPAELMRVRTLVNQLVDRVSEHAPGPHEGQEAHPREPTHDPTHEIARQALVYLLARQPEPLVVIDERGQILAASTHALDALNGPDGQGLARALAAVPAQAGVAHDSIAATALPGVKAWLCALGPARANLRHDA